MANLYIQYLWDRLNASRPKSGPCRVSLGRRRWPILNVLCKRGAIPSLCTAGLLLRFVFLGLSVMTLLCILRCDDVVFLQEHSCPRQGQVGALCGPNAPGPLELAEGRDFHPPHSRSSAAATASTCSSSHGRADNLHADRQAFSRVADWDYRGGIA